MDNPVYELSKRLVELGMEVEDKPFHPLNENASFATLTFRADGEQAMFFIELSNMIEDVPQRQHRLWADISPRVFSSGTGELIDLNDPRVWAILDSIRPYAIGLETVEP